MKKLVMTVTVSILVSSLLVMENKAQSRFDCLPLVENIAKEGPEVLPISGVRTGNGISFTPDGCTLFITRDMGGIAQILSMKRNSEGWSKPEQLSIVNSPYHDYQPRLSPDGQHLYFNSARIMPGREKAEDVRKIWVSNRLKNGESPEWSKPAYLKELNTSDPAIRDNYVSVIEDGSIYFRSSRRNTRQYGDIFVSRMINGRLSEPELVEAVSSESDENDLFVSPDETIMVLNRWSEADEDIYLLISLNFGDGWSPPRRLTILDTPKMELTPTISPDGKHFLYEHDGVIQIVDFDFLLNADERKKLESSKRPAKP